MKKISKYSVQLVRESFTSYDIIDTKIDSSGSAKDILKVIYDLDMWHNEKFGIMCLDAQSRIVGVHLISEGTVNEASVHIREVAVRALTNNAVSIILFHNHPSGSKNPSSADISLTSKMVEALKLLHIKVLDHLIYAEGDVISLKETGDMD